MKALIIAVFVFVLGVAPQDEAFAKWEGLKQCQQDAEVANNYMPVRLDEVTLWTKAECVPGGTGVIVRYHYELSIPASMAFPAYLKEKLYPGFLDIWCGRSDHKKFIEHQKVDVVFWLPDGKYITSFRVAANDC